MRFNLLNTIRYYIKKYGNAEKPLRFFLCQALPKTPLCRLLIIQMSSFRLRFYPSNISASCWYNPSYLRSDEEFFELYLKKGDTVIDVGANIGLLTLKAASIVSDTGKVFSIEPHPIIFKYLNGNIKLNQFCNVETFNCAIGSRQEISEISSMGTADDRNRIVEQGGIKIKTETLDSLFERELESIDLLKIDVEGYEKFAVMGGDRLLKKTKCVYFESYQPNFDKYGYQTGDLIEMFKSHGFEITRINKGKLEPVPSTHVSVTCENLVAIRDMEDFIKRTHLHF
jgi:FkbM family methyltransferase